MSRKTLIASVGASAVVATSLLGPPSTSTAAAGQAVWGPPTPISAAGVFGDGPWQPDVAVDASGNTTAVWYQGEERGVVKAARRPAKGHWRAPVTIGRGWFPQVGADARGNVTVIWRDSRARVMSARRPAGGGWGAPVALSEPGDFGSVAARDYRLAVSRGGAAVVTWWYGVWPDEGSGADRAEAVYRPAHGRWSSPRTLGRLTDQSPAVAIDARGNVTAAFPGPQHRIRAVRRVVGRGWLSSVRISADKPQPPDTRLEVAVDARGDATALWGEWGDGWTAASRPLFHRWSTPASLAAPSGPKSEATIGMDDDGTALVVETHEHGWVSVRSKPLRRPWGVRRTIVPVDGSFRAFPQLVLNPGGDALVSWEGPGRHWTWNSSYRPDGGSWGSPQRLARYALGPGELATALYRNGNAVAVWSRDPQSYGGADVQVWSRMMTAPN